MLVHLLPPSQKAGRRYELFFIVVKLRVAVRRASRRLKALIITKVHLIQVQNFKIKVTCQVKVRSEATISVFTFWALGSVRRAAIRGQTRPKCWIDVQKGYC